MNTDHNESRYECQINILKSDTKLNTHLIGVVIDKNTDKNKDRKALQICKDKYASFKPTNRNTCETFIFRQTNANTCT